MIWNSRCHSPALRFSGTPASGTTCPSIITSCEPVPRMPCARQVSSTFTCGEFMGMPKCSTIGGWPGSSRIALVISRSPVCAPEVKTLRAVIL